MPTPSFSPPPPATSLGVVSTRRAVALLVGGSTAYGLLVLALVYAGGLAPGVTLTREVVILSLSRGLEWIVVGPLLLVLYRRIQTSRLAGLPRVVAYALAAAALHTVTEVGHTAFAQGVVGYGDQLSFSEFYWSSWKNNALIHTICYVGLTGFVHGYDRHMEYLRIVEAYRAREVREAHLESELAQAQLHALRMQLNPHFLFNALSAAAALTKRDASRARRVLVDLGELLRLALDTTEEEVPLRDELVFLDRYLRIEQARMGGRLRVRIHVEDDALDILVPPLLLQPLVENAVKHGVAPLEEGGDVDLAAAQDGDHLVVTVRDTGRGLSTAAPDARGIGLENVRRRLDRLHGEAASLSLDSPPGGGLVATVRLPLRTFHASPAALCSTSA